MYTDLLKNEKTLLDQELITLKMPRLSPDDRELHLEVNFLLKAQDNAITI
jgi:hypothetical protein